MNIEDLNSFLIKSKSPDLKLTNTYLSSNFHINEDLLKDVINHRKIFGISHKISILKSLVKTKKFVKTIYPNGQKRKT
jgi:hypothetical protein